MEPTHDPPETPELRLSTLADQHPGVTAELGATYSQAAGVCLSRHHVPPVEILVSRDPERPTGYTLTWTPPTDRVRAAWANDDDATRDGAYALVLASSQAHLGLIAVARTPVGSGADYFVRPETSSEYGENEDYDVDSLLRLEISGIDRCRGQADVQRRLRQKVSQARAGQSDRPAIVGVVAFNILRVVLRSVG